MKSRWFLPATSCALLATMLPGNASITVTFKQVGSDVVAAIYGSIEYDVASRSVTLEHGGGYLNGDPGWRLPAPTAFGVYFPNQDRLLIYGDVSNPPAGYASWMGMNVFHSPWVLSDVWSTFMVAGDEKGSRLFISPSATSPFHGQSLTWLDSSLEELDAATFANTVVWTSLDDPSQKVYFNTVPEPSSALSFLVGVSAFGLVRKRRIG